MNRGFWDTLPTPIIGLAPMDGVTDAAMRHITKKYGHPAVMFTEFTSAEGVIRGALRLMKDFAYDESQRPIVAQIFGSDPKAFYQTAIVVAYLGFDGVDINMGCPAKSVEERGAGAALINNPRLAGQIIKATQKGLKDFAAGISLETAGVHPDITTYIKGLNRPVENKLLPLSVKTRIGVDTPVTESWIAHLLKFDLANISLHGRTLKQLYSGEADWDEIAKAAKLVKGTGTTLLGNGDVKDMADAREKIKKYDVDGILFGRAAFGNPWVFKGKNTTPKTKLKVAAEHALKHEEFFGPDYFLPMRKHLAWYSHGFPNASDLRQKLVLSQSASEVASILNQTVDNL